ncbi:unnamed protein product [Paramecium sonneborni]|uniref:Uncharacterized protein n=1 Tax=Paramecium sonneborni TaxID=65129 RepID=A0A8S1PYM6_9CILI|nr:unnamed protein product [Paramecium sonneborni]
MLCFKTQIKNFLRDIKFNESRQLQINNHPFGSSQQSLTFMYQLQYCKKQIMFDYYIQMIKVNKGDYHILVKLIKQIIQIQYQQHIFI